MVQVGLISPLTLISSTLWRYVVKSQNLLGLTCITYIIRRIFFESYFTNYINMRSKCNFDFLPFCSTTRLPYAIHTSIWFTCSENEFHYSYCIHYHTVGLLPMNERNSSPNSVVLFWYAPAALIIVCMPPPDSKPLSARSLSMIS